MYVELSSKNKFEPLVSFVGFTITDLKSFPFIVVKGGTHIMILNKFRWLNENLPKIILEEKN